VPGQDEDPCGFLALMNITQIVRRFLWGPGGYIPSLESLNPSHGMAAMRHVTMAVSGLQSGYPLTVAELGKGKIIGDLRMVATAGDIVVGGLQSLFGCPDGQNHYLLRRRRFRMLKRRHGTALLLGAANSDNYYHWIADSVPRWAILRAANEANYDFVLLPGRAVPFQDEVLDRLNVPGEKRLRCLKHFVHQFERLVVPSMPFPVEEIAPWTCAYLRSLFPEKSHGPEKIYLRRGAGRRRLVNEPELEAALGRMGFISVESESLTVAEQAKLLSSARSVVAPHGAALTNLVFAPPGALLMELFHPEHKNRCYINLAAACGHRYASVDGQATEAAGGKLEYSIDIATVEREVRKF
jgi:hypothetical protein